MEAHDFFLTLLVILLMARIFAELTTRLQAPSVHRNCWAASPPDWRCHGVSSCPWASRCMPTRPSQNASKRR
jgi:hypothetical protein